jgi:phage baseplate assembly protein W
MREAKQSSSNGFSVAPEKSAVREAVTMFEPRLRASSASGTDECFARFRGTEDGPNCWA